MAVRGVLTQWLKSESPSRPSIDGRPAAMPPGQRAYAVGDIHGRLDLLLAMEQLIRADMEAYPPSGETRLIHLGDYVDRGSNSAGVIEHLIRRPMPNLPTTLLRGNHDDWFRLVLEGGGPDADWIRHGGGATLASYGLSEHLPPIGEEREVWRRSLRRRVPAAHQRFLQNLQLWVRMGDYFFCHAGIRPGIAVDQQGSADLMWIRHEFLDHTGNLGVVVVHGHTIVDRPVIKHNRIGIDTGAVRSGRLTAVVLEGTEFRFLSTDGL